ncbi:MAG: phosphoglucosamine mutase, partial [Actinomyces sp.]
WCADHGVAGAVVSASHNPWHDNGIKLFAPGGLKLGDDAQHEVQRLLDVLVAESAGVGTLPDPGGTPAGGAADAGDDTHERALAAHAAAVTAAVGGRRLDGLRLVVDCAHGAAWELAPRVLADLGADVTAIGVDPDGRNINDACGSTHLATLAAAVVDAGADCGIAFDGDADRVLAVDAHGEVVDGDQIIAVCALDLDRRGLLRGRAVVVTVMANLGFRRAMATAGIEVVETPVGDRHVLEALDRRGLVLGGEQSGHVIFRDHATTGDGLLTAAVLLDTLVRDGRDLATLAGEAMTRLPQVLVNVAVAARPADLDRRLGPALAAARTRLGDRGRILVRPSGTEPLVRVMVEADTVAEAETVAAELAREVETACGPGAGPAS